ncbi:MAG: broad specificity phosphatase PhoE [Bradymonadia bacterium]|jgi:broad specificity phosphatase PhoE
MADLETAFQRRELYLVCHDALADDGMIAGRSEIGIRSSARSRYEFVRTLLPTGDEVEYYACSSRRIQQSAARIWAEAQWEHVDSLLPRGMGKWEERTWSDVRETDAVRAEAFWSSFESQAAPGGGEPLADVAERAQHLLTGLSNRPSWTKAVACTSPEVIGSMVCSVLGDDLKTMLRFDVDPLSITRLTHTWIGWQLGSLNITP